MLDRNIHKSILLQILKDIYTDTSLGPFLGFKGGTATHLLYKLVRFSLDLDFDLLNKGFI
jgi:predicted nucleotidyltransferase component of viral defense system